MSASDRLTVCYKRLVEAGVLSEADHLALGTPTSEAALVPVWMMRGLLNFSQTIRRPPDSFSLNALSADEQKTLWRLYMALGEIRFKIDRLERKATRAKR